MGSPQSLNLYAYVGNNPIDFVDPLGLTYFSLPEEQECHYEPKYYKTEVEIIDDDSANPVLIGRGGGGSSEGVDWVLVCSSKGTINPITTPEPGIGGGGGTSDLSQTPKNCVDALKRAGFWNKIVSLYKTANFYNILDIGSEPASKYFGDSMYLGNRLISTKGFTVGDIYTQLDAVAFGYQNGVHGTGKTGIYSIYDKENMENGVLIHELAHLAAQKGDIALALSLRLKLKKRATNRDAGLALGDYFENGCDPSLLRKGKK